MNRKIVREAAGQRDTHAALKHEETHKVRQEVVTMFTYCNKEHSHLSPIFYIQVGISRTQDHWSFHNGTPQRPHHSVEDYTCSGRTDAAAKLSHTNLTAESSPERLIGKLQSNPIIHNLNYPANLFVTAIHWLWFQPRLHH